MGYQVDHLGTFTVTPPMDADLRAWIDGPLLEDPWAAAEARGVPADIDSWCTWWTGDGDGSTLSWTGAEKSYDGAAWMQWLLDHVLGPAGHEVVGTVHRFAEPETGFVELSRIVADGRTVTEVPYEVDELPWGDGDEETYLADAFFHLSEGEPEEGQQLLLAWLGATPLATHPGLVAFLHDTAGHWPDPTAVRDAASAASTRTTAAAPAAGDGGDGGGRRSLWDRLLGR